MTTKLDQQLAEQNQIRSWRPCEALGRSHTLSAPELVRSAYGSEVFDPPTTVQRCRRCPVSIMTVRVKTTDPAWDGSLGEGGTDPEGRW